MWVIYVSLINRIFVWFTQRRLKRFPSPPPPPPLNSLHDRRAYPLGVGAKFDLRNSCMSQNVLCHFEQQKKSQFMMKMEI